MSGDELLLAGRVGPPHGLDGSFRVMEAAPGLLGAGQTILLDGRWRVIERHAGHPGRVILRLTDITDRDQITALRGHDLMADRKYAPPLEEDEWWASDLEGCAVADGDRPVGTVLRLLAYPSCELLEVARSHGGDPLLVPLVGDAVRSVDVVAKRIDIDLAFLGEA